MGSVVRMREGNPYEKSQKDVGNSNRRSSDSITMT